MYLLKEKESNDKPMAWLYVIYIRNKIGYHAPYM